MKCGCYIRFHGISTKELGERLCSNQILEISYFFSVEMPKHNHWLSINLTRNIFVFETYFRVNYQKSHTHTHKNNILANNIFYQLRYFCVVPVPEAFGPLFYVHFFGPLEG